jgi:ABC-2 type transport system permease protein
MKHLFRLFFSSFSIELKQKLTYRLDTAIDLLVTLLARSAVGYFIWSAIFAGNNATSIGGMRLPDIVIYYLLAALVDSLVSLRIGFIAEDIYLGKLTKYLIIPLPFSLFKLASALAENIAPFFQVALVYLVVLLVYSDTLSAPLSLSTGVLGILSCLSAFILSFSIHCAIEFWGFWMDKVWSLIVMFNLTAQFLGGLLLPIEAFPEMLQPALKVLPFYYMVGFPTSVLMGRTTGAEVLLGLVISLSWTLITSLLASQIWKRGIVRYGAVGI